VTATVPPPTGIAGTGPRDWAPPPMPGTAVKVSPLARWVGAPPVQQAISVGLGMLSGILIFLLINLTCVSQLQHITSQAHLYSQLRLTLAQGSTPVAPTTKSGAVVALGTPVAVLSAPSIGIGREVIVEGSASEQTMEGIGHRRDTVLPCQVGSSVLMARSGAYGGIGDSWTRLQNGDRFTIMMGQGSCTYQVTGMRYAGDKAPPAPTGRQGALTLVTASGLPFVPLGLVRIDAALVSKSYDRPSIVFPSGALPAAEQPMGVDTSQLFAITILLEALVGLAIGATWLWRRWGKWQTWIVVTPLALAAGFLTATNFDYLLPNLL
jgi:sortase A